MITWTAAEKVTAEIRSPLETRSGNQDRTAPNTFGLGLLSISTNRYFRFVLYLVTMFLPMPLQETSVVRRSIADLRLRLCPANLCPSSD
jgi:hypothetical protein